VIIQKKPRFSIVMPTRSHAQFLPKALQSALGQSHDDFEIVVSDNWSTDGTADVVHSYASPRIRYFRPERPLPLAKNFEYGLSRATGEYVTFLSDDDAFVPNLIESAADLLNIHDTDLFAWNMCSYHYGDHGGSSKGSSVTINPFTGEAAVVDARRMLTKAFSEHVPHCWPFLLNCLYRRRFLQQCQSQSHCLFTPLAGDIYCGVLALSSLDNYIHLDRPLTLYGWRADNSSTLLKREPERMFEGVDEEFHESREMLCDPLGLPLEQCALHSALLRGKAVVGDSARDLEWNPVPYFVGAYGQLLELRSDGRDVEAYVGRFWAVLGEQPVDVQERVRKGIHQLQVPMFRRIVRRMREKSLLFSRVEMALRPGMPPRARRVSGKDGGFSDILQCATKLDEILGGKLTMPYTLRGRSEGLRATAARTEC
jgi:glycosyltransferase involved in cell wall biosynthesis